ncbi:MAG TPA: hypothetical protein VF487_16075 [Chitinophagaceae bacterium]
MKSNHHQPFYFSAYPLKAIPKSSESTANQSPYLRSILAAGSSSNIRTSSRVRVFPMTNPYKASEGTARKARLSKNIEATGDEWFNHYE